MAAGTSGSANIDLGFSQLTLQINDADKALVKMMKNYEKLGKKVYDAVGKQNLGGLTGYLPQLKELEKRLNAIGGKNITLGVDTKEVKTAKNELSDIIKYVDALSKGTKGAMKFSGSAKSVDQMRKAISLLDEVRNKENLNSARGRANYAKLTAEIDRQKAAVERITNAEKVQARARKQWLEQENRRWEIQKRWNERSRSQYSGAMDYSRQAKSLEDMRRAMQYIENARSREKRDTDESKRKYQELTNELNRQKKAVDKLVNAEKRRIDILNRLNERRLTRYDGAMNYSRQAKSLNDLQKSIRYLDEARKKENLTTAEGRRNYARLTAEMERQQNAMNRLSGNFRGAMGIVSQLGSAMATAFSVQAISGYINKLITVRGEFEMQHRSLQVLLQDKDAADKLWSQTVALAVKSPFTTKQLITYTKQLAAYRIETEKLYETNKMLADISSGLGVDMNRLILAYGQVKAANYLRGTELRQFSEAGVNLLGELADRFTDLEGRVVSVGDVFERVSKRMVSFEDVDAVLKKLTGEGGVFYQMQEQQSETLKGRIMNLRDSIELMYNEMGESMDGTLKGSVDFVKSLVDNWEMVGVAIKGVVSALLIYKGALMATTLWSSMNSLRMSIAAAARGTQVLIRAQKMYNLVCFKNPYVAGAAVAIGAVLAIVSAISAASKKQREFNRIVGEGLTNANELSHRFKTLADTAVSAADGTRDQREALDQLKNVYSDILPAQMLEIKTLKEMKGNYDEVTAAIHAKIEARTKEKLIEKVQSEEGANLQKSESALVESLYQKGVSKKAARAMIEEFKQEYKKEMSDDEIFALAQKKLAKRTNKTTAGIAFYMSGTKELNDEFSNFIEEFNEYNDAVAEIRDKDLFDDAFDFKSFRALNSEFDEVKKKQEEWGTFNKDLSKEENKGFETQLEFDEAKSQAYIKSLSDFLKKVNEVITKGVWNEEKLGKNDIASLKVLAANIQKEIDSISPKGLEKIIEDLRLSVTKETGVDFARLSATVKKENQSFKQYVEEIDSNLETRRKELDVLLSSKSTEAEKTAIVSYQTEEELLKAKIKLQQEYNALLLFRNKINSTPLKTSKADKKQNSTLKERIDLYVDMNKAYEENRKLWSDDIAQQKVVEGFRERASKLGVDIGTDWNASRIQGIEEEITKTEELKSAYQELIDSGMSVEQARAKFLEAFGDLATSNDWDKIIEELTVGLKDREDFRGNAYLDGKTHGVWTLGYGFTYIKDKETGKERAVKKGDTMTKEEADAYIDEIVGGYTEVVRVAIDKGLIKLNDTQAMVLSDLAYNGGKGLVTSIFKESKFDKDIIAEKLLTYATTQAGVWMRGLQERANWRHEMFTKEPEKLSIAEDEDVLTYLNKQMDVLKNRLEAANKLKEEINKARPFSDEGTIKELEYLIANAKTQEEYLAVYDKLSTLQATKGAEKREKTLEELDKEAATMFDMYELTKRMEDSDIPKQMAEIFGFKTMDFSQLKKGIKDMESLYADFNIKGAESYKKLLDKLDDMENKATEERMRTYSKYLTKGYSEAVKIKMDETKKLMDIEKLKADAIKELNRELTAEEGNRFNLMQQGVRRETQEAMDKQAWEDFKGTDMYTMMFEDLENYGTNALDKLQERLEGLKDSLKNLDPTQVKEVVSQINKIEDALINRNPFAELKKIRKELNSLPPKEDLEIQLINAEKESARLKTLIDDVDIVNAAMNSKDSAMALNEVSDDAKKNYEEIKEYAAEMGISIEAAVANLKKQKQEQDGIAESASKGLNIYAKEIAALKGQEQVWGEIKSSVDEAFESIKSIMETMGAESDGVETAVLDAVQTMISLVFQGIMFHIQLQLIKKAAVGVGASLQAALGVIGWISMALTAVVGLMSAFLGNKDKRLENQIQDLQARVESLQRAFEKLEEAMDNSFNMSQYERDFDKAEKNLKSQIEATRQMIALEEEKKDTDQSKIQDYRNQIEDYNQQLKELQDQRIEDLGGFGSEANYKSAAEDFVDAWFEAYKETGDGLSGLNERFDEFIENLIKKQLTMRIAARFLDPLLEEVDEMFAEDSVGGGKVLKSELDKVLAMAKETMPEFSAALTEVFESLGGLNIEQSGGSLSELSKNISSITEAQASAIEALLNSMRLYVADSNQQLKEQTRYLKKLWDFFDGMSTNSSSTGKGLRVHLAQA